MPVTPLRAIPQHPIAGGLGLIAIGLFALAGDATDAFVFDARAFEGESWRVLTATLVHGGLLHLGMNVYWLWTLGAPLEERMGSVPLGGLVLCTALGSALPQYALSGNAIGLSGVVYGLAGFLWLAGRHNPRYSGILSQRDASFLLFWFGLCIALTAVPDTPLFRVANVAHGAGAVFGLLAAASATVGGWRRAGVFVGATALLVLAGIGATVARPQVNFSSSASREHLYLGSQAAERNDWERAERHFRRATEFRDVDPRAHYNLGVAQSRRGDTAAATTSFARARELGLEDSP
ncbi:MAG: rhomboid family intramembrane serine protease [Myxococcales bacterium FL481]|nr:MAG: rhomboid family intramembrane serine protease [Myxococcales bacterium FL481]